MRKDSATATETIRALGTTRMRRLTAPHEVEHRVRMLLDLVNRRLERGDTDSARAMLVALRPDDFGSRARRAEAPLSILHHRPTSASELRLVLRAFEQLLPQV